MTLKKELSELSLIAESGYTQADCELASANLLNLFETMRKIKFRTNKQQ